MEVVIEAKKFSFSSIRSSVSFRVIEEGRKIKQAVDLKLQEALWVVNFLRGVFKDGHQPDVWKSRVFSGRSFSASCKANPAGSYVELAIFGARRRLKTIMIPVGVELAGIRAFADALAATTAGPERRDQVGGDQMILYNEVGGASRMMGGWPYAEVVAGDTCRELLPEGARGSSNQVENWCVVWGLVPEKWRLEAFNQIKLFIPGVVCVVPVVAEMAVLMVRISGKESEVPELLPFWLKGQPSEFCWICTCRSRWLGGLVSAVERRAAYLEERRERL